MTDLEQAIEALLFLDPLVTTVRETLKAGLDKNQNPGSGGDGLMTEEELNHLRSAQNALTTLGYITDKFRVKPAGGAPYVGEGPALAVLETYVPAAPEAHVIGSEVDALNRVCVLLSDDRLLVSKELDDKHCAELHAEQVVRLKLPGTLLLSMGWGSFEEPQAL